MTMFWYTPRSWACEMKCNFQLSKYKLKINKSIFSKRLHRGLRGGAGVSNVEAASKMLAMLQSKECEIKYTSLCNTKWSNALSVNENRLLDEWVQREILEKHSKTTWQGQLSIIYDNYIFLQMEQDVCDLLTYQVTINCCQKPEGKASIGATKVSYSWTFINTLIVFKKVINK